MNIYVLPRSFFIEIKQSAIEKYIFNHYNIISINTPEYNPRNIIKEHPPFSKKYWNKSNVLILYFHDWIAQDNDLIKLITDEDVNKIINFVKNIDQNNNLIIHCTAGISRSGAVGSCLNYFINGYDNLNHYNNFMKNYTYLKPNTLVFQKLYNKLQSEEFNKHENTNKLC